MQIKVLLEQELDVDEIVAQIYIGLDPKLVPYARYTTEAHIAKILREK